MSLTTAEKAKIKDEHKRSENDTGSVEVQVSLLTGDIKQLTEHFKTHDHDYHSRRGLMQKVSRRRKLLKYLRSSDLQRYRDLIAKLGIREIN